MAAVAIVASLEDVNHSLDLTLESVASAINAKFLQGIVLPWIGPFFVSYKSRYIDNCTQTHRRRGILYPLECPVDPIISSRLQLLHHLLNAQLLEQPKTIAFNVINSLRYFDHKSSDLVFWTLGSDTTQYQVRRENWKYSKDLKRKKSTLHSTKSQHFIFKHLKLTFLYFIN